MVLIFFSKKWTKLFCNSWFDIIFYSQDDIQAINCFKFALTLKKLATKEDMEKEELLDKAKELQKMFRETESDEEDDLMNEFDQEFTNWM